MAVVEDALQWTAAEASIAEAASGNRSKGCTHQGCDRGEELAPRGRSTRSSFLMACGDLVEVLERQQDALESEAL